MYKFELSAKEVNLIFQGLSELPWKLSSEVISKIQNLVNEQNVAANKAVEEAKKEK